MAEMNPVLQNCLMMSTGDFSEKVLFQCRFCVFSCKTLKNYLEHRKYHRNITTTYSCGFHDCKKVLGTETSLRSHLIRSHMIRIRNTENKSTVFASNTDGKYKCTVLYCAKEMDSHQELIRHLIDHIKNGIEIICPMYGCNKTYSLLTSFKGHMSRNHRMVRDERYTPTLPDVNSISMHEQQDPQSIEKIFDSWIDEDPSDELEINETSCASAFKKDLFVNNIIDFYMKLEFQKMIPRITIENIVNEIKCLNQQSYEAIRFKLIDSLTKKNMCLEEIELIITETLREILLEPYDYIKTDYHRKQMYKKLYPFVSPRKETIKDGKYFYYVPIQETLEASFKDKSIEIRLESPVQHDDGVLNDYTDGTVFSNNEVFTHNRHVLHLILYQDAFELVCPIGPARKIHKVVGIYLSIGNLPDYLRTHIDSIKLVALCKETDMDHNVVYGKIVNDLKILETEGICVPGYGTVKCGLVFIAGDNLGSHSLGGFNENFSRSTYFCRYCNVDRSSFHSECGYYKTFPQRTIESYKTSLEAQKDKMGIKFDSVFNQLQHFHVCKPGLPPCFAHDIFEGFAAYDVLMYINYFVDKGWFSIEILNEKINSFPYSPQDRRDKPVQLTPNGQRLIGGAWQIWSFLRFLPLMIQEFIENINDPVWKTLILLIEIIEIICAPSIHVSYLPYLQELIYAYLDSRVENFPEIPLRPKHHYLVHYPELILAFGPLIKVWTLRFENKHTFFKRAIRSSHNFINVLFSLANRHELFQCYLRSGANLKCLVTVSGAVNFNSHVYSKEIQEVVNKIPLSDHIQECASIVIKGTRYQKGDIVIFSQTDYQFEIEMGRISIILSDNSEKIHFVVDLLHTEFIPHMRVYKLRNVKKVDHIANDNLVSYYPLPTYTMNNTCYVKLKHGLVSKHI